jgi:hypothetical protein
MVVQTILVTFYVILALSGCIAQEEQKAVNTSILEISEDPLKYESKVVRITAWFRTSPYGVSLESDDFKKRIPLVRVDSEGVQLPPQLSEVKDQLYNHFWEYVDKNEMPDTGAHGVRVELDGYIRLLKKNGKLTNEFYIYGQRPIEIILLKIRKMEIYP